MLNSSEDPELVSGRFQPMKAIEEIQSIWDPSKGSLQRSVPDVFKQKSKRKYSQAEETIKATSQSPTSSPDPKTDLGARAGRALTNEASYAFAQLLKGKIPYFGK
jgi:hypothetical protein